MQLPNVPGLGFYPTNEQLLLLYLRQRILESFRGSSPSTNAHIIPDIDLCRWKPWDLPSEIERLSPLGYDNREEWYFFCPNLNEKCSSLERNVANVGYWKVTGKIRTMRSETTGQEIGIRKTLVFYRGYFGCGVRTNWVIHECHLNPSCIGPEMPFIVCRLYKNAIKKDDCDESACRESESSSNHGASYNQEPSVFDETK